MRTSLGILLGIVMALGLIVFMPLVFIWSVSTLFQIPIAYTFYNWVAALTLIILFNANNN